MTAREPSPGETGCVPSHLASQPTTSRPQTCVETRRDATGRPKVMLPRHLQSRSQGHAPLSFRDACGADIHTERVQPRFGEQVDVVALVVSSRIATLEPRPRAKKKSMIEGQPQFDRRTVTVIANNGRDQSPVSGRVTAPTHFPEHQSRPVPHRIEQILPSYPRLFVFCSKTASKPDGRALSSHPLTLPQPGTTALPEVGSSILPLLSPMSRSTRAGCAPDWSHPVLPCCLSRRHVTSAQARGDEERTYHRSSHSSAKVCE
jgi:hypothetical protein